MNFNRVCEIAKACDNLPPIIEDFIKENDEKTN